MKWRKLMRSALESLSRNTMRSLLTMLGIIIGVGSVISLVSLGQGSQQDVQAQIAAMGTNLIIIRPGETRAGGVSAGASSLNTLTMNDVAQLRQHTTLLAGTTPEIRVQAQGVAGSNNWSTTTYGVSTDYPTIRNVKLARGTFFSERDDAARAKVAVLGQTVAQELFPGVDPVGQQLRIGRTPFKVIGVLQARGQNAMGMDQDDLILAPASTVLFRLSDGKTVSVILASARAEDQMSAAKEEVSAVLRRTHRLAEGETDDFQLGDQTEINSMATSITGTLTMLVSAVAGVSLLVGGIGIMNIMLVSVTERTREIGLRMAIGARGSDVLTQFLLEAVLLSLAGGVLGVTAGLGLAYGLGALLGSSVVVQPALVVLSVLFTGAVGVFFGYYPARTASRLNPIEALRYE